MNIVELILKKREGQELTSAEIAYCINSYINGFIPDYQISSLLMAIFFRGMTDKEIVDLTKTYIDSGVKISFPKELHTADKHSTGGVGDKISLMLAPVAAALGVKIPMISGRGLGHTGGTLDKLESIPGLSTAFNDGEFKKMVLEHDLAIISQSQKLVPADKKIYALRDVTGTVESLPLITASIMSKKIAEGAQNLVVDLKVGSGAFMKTMEQAKELGRLLKMVGESMGQKVKIVFTNMNSPLGRFLGNALEVKETVLYLQNQRETDIDVITKALTSQILLLTGKASALSEAEEKIEEVIRNGKALEKFRRFIELQGGNPQICENLQLLPCAEHKIPIFAQEDGYVQAINSQEIGFALISVGAGRLTLQTALNYGAGAEIIGKVGDYVTTTTPLGYVYADEKESGVSAARKIAASYTLSKAEIKKEKLILGTL